MPVNPGEPAEERRPIKHGCATFFVTTFLVGGGALALGFYTQVIGPCPQPKDWVPEWLKFAILLGLFGAPLVGLILGAMAAGPSKTEVGTSRQPVDPREGAEPPPDGDA